MRAGVRVRERERVRVRVRTCVCVPVCVFLHARECVRAYAWDFSSIARAKEFLLL